MADSPSPGNPYAAPAARLSDPTIAGASGELIENGQRVEAAREMADRAIEMRRVSGRPPLPHP